MTARLLLAVLSLAVAVLPAEAQLAWPAEAPPRPLPAREAKFPPYEVRTLPNGLRVVAVLHHEQPVVSMRLILQAGSSQDPRNKLGLARLTAALLDQGTTTQTAEQINDGIDFIGGALGAGAGADLSFVNLVVMKDSFDLGLRLLSDVARRPAFAQDEIERQRQQIVSSLQVSLQSPEFIAHAVFNRLVYGFHPYGMPDTGTPQTLAAIVRDDLLAFHQRTFVPNNAILAIVGDVTADEAFAGVTKVFGDWTRRDPPPQPTMAPPDPTRRVIVVNKADAVQTEIRVGHLGVQRNHPDYMPLNLAIRILGGEGANRLHQVLRTERGLTYGAQAHMDTFRDSGDFEAETNTRTEATGEVLRLVLEQFSRLQRDRVGERELSDAKAYLTGSFPLTIEKPGDIATQVLNVLFYGLPVEQLQSFRERVNAVTVADVERVARTYLKPDRASIVLVGNAAAFVPQLKGLNLGAFELIEMADLDLTAADFKSAGNSTTGVGGGAPVRPAGSRFFFRSRAADGEVLHASPGPDQSATGHAAEDRLTSRQLLEKVIEAKGGLDVLRGIKSIRAVAKAPTVGADVTTYLEYPNKMRVETTLPGGTRLEVFDGRHGWVRDPAGVHDVPDEALRSMELSFRRDTIAMLLAAYDGTISARSLPDVKDEKNRVFHALEFSSPKLDPIVLYVDPASFLIAKQVYIAAAPGKPVVEEIFTDYKTIGGVSIAFHATIRSGGQQIYERRLTDLEINPSIDARLFSRPGS